LQESKTDQEREDVKRRLKRLEEEQQQMLADADEVKQRMERPENQSSMAQEKQQLDQTREDLQKRPRPPRPAPSRRRSPPARARSVAPANARRSAERKLEPVRRRSARDAQRGARSLASAG